MDKNNISENEYVNYGTNTYVTPPSDETQRFSILLKDALLEGRKIMVSIKGTNENGCEVLTTSQIVGLTRKSESDTKYFDHFINLTTGDSILFYKESKRHGTIDFVEISIEAYLI